MGLHHATLKAAVKAYGHLHSQGKSADEVKAAIAADEKQFEGDAVNEIYRAIIFHKDGEQPCADKLKKADGYTVVSEFRDKDKWEKLYQVGDDVSHFDEDRLANLVERKLVEAK